MSLTPTLLSTLATSVAVGSIVISGLEPTILSDKALPSQATLSFAGNLPSVVSSQGPTSSPEETALIGVEGKIPFLSRSLTVYPLLPDAEGEENDLTPTLTENVIQPSTPISHAMLAWSGPVPALIQNGGQYIYPIVGSVVLNGLAPTSVLPEWQYPDRYPGKVTLETIPLEPTLILQRVTEGTAGSFSIQGLEPTLTQRYGWTTVASSSSPVWTDIPRV